MKDQVAKTILQMRNHNTPLYHKACGHKHDCDCDEQSSSDEESSYIESEMSQIEEEDECFEY